MKKYIAFIVADVVLLAYTCYITCSLTTQEKEVTPEERESAIEVFYESVALANRIGPTIVDEAENFTPVVTTTAAILLSHFCIIANISMYDAVDILMSAYKNISENHKDES